MNSLLKGFWFAFHGWLIAFKTQRHVKIQFLISFLVIAGGIAFQINSTEWMLILLCIGGVISLELMNTAIEFVCNYIQPDLHPDMAKIKDVAAGAVLWFSMISLIIGFIIFIPRFYQLMIR